MSLRVSLQVSSDFVVIEKTVDHRLRQMSEIIISCSSNFNNPSISRLGAPVIIDSELIYQLWLIVLTGSLTLNLALPVTVSDA